MRLHPFQKAAMVLLALGTIGGYSLGFASMRCHSRERRESFEQHVAKVCVDAARDGNRPSSPRFDEETR